MTPSAQWRTLTPLARVNPWNKGRRSRTWEDRRDEYARLTTEPIIVTAQLATPVLHAERERTHLDSILAFAALTDHPVRSAFGAAAVFPLPLDLVWVSPTGQPLWACTPLMPAGDGVATREYWHKRYPSHRAELGRKLNANTTAGRWKEYRTPVHAQSVDRLHALAIGNGEEVSRLLATVTHIGKKTSIGYGRVAHWHVTRASHTLADVLAMRSVPIAYCQDSHLVGQIAPNCGWTPPYWYAPWWTDCVVPT